MGIVWGERRSFHRNAGRRRNIEIEKQEQFSRTEALFLQPFQKMINCPVVDSQILIRTFSNFPGKDGGYYPVLFQRVGS